ncbi:MAG: oxygenase MpaB family protein [Actinomycetota bacterium]
MDAGLFGPESISWRVHRETTVLFGGARALLMHAVHPLVVAGARETGFYERDPWKRLERTLILTYAITFGTTRDASRAADRINEVHRHVNGIDPVTGLPYDAFDPELLLWVHASLVDSALRFEELTVGALSPEERERFHREQMVVAEMLHLPRSSIPASVGDLRAYIEAVVDSGILRLTDASERVAALFREPPPDAQWRPILRRVSGWAFGTLPPKLRWAYGVRWNPLREARLRAELRALRTLRPAIPRRFRLIMPAHLAERRLRAA